MSHFNSCRFFCGVVLVTMCCADLTAESIPAFPGAEGFGAHSRGGRGGKIIFVTTLDDYIPGKQEVIPGSLRAACETSGPRTVIFSISGTIELVTTLRISDPYITIAGQSAPGAGICTKNYGVTINTHDVIVRHLRCRPGDEVGRKLKKIGKSWSTDALSISAPGRNVILDHCSVSWANDEVCSVSGAGITDVTVQWCIISESLNDSTHSKGSHGYGSLIRCNGNVSFHHNLYAFHRSRSPRPGTYGDGSILFDFRNNLMHMGGQGYSAADPVRMNFVANYHTTTPFKASSSCEYFSEGNVGEISGGKRRKSLYRVAEVTTTTARKARDAILASCGAILPRRDAVDVRIIELVRTNRGNRIDTVSEVDGWPKLASGPPPKDSDRDGMPDAWELKYDLNTHRANNNDDGDSDGYTDIEEFLNGTNPRKADEQRSAKDPPELWDRSRAVPRTAEVPLLPGVRFSVIKPYEFNKDGYRFLHGVALAWHRGRLFASFGHNRGGENTDTEEARFCTSKDGGRTWSAIRTIASGQEGTGVSHGVFLSHAGKLWAFHGAYAGILRNVHTLAFVLDESTDSWQPVGKVIDGGFWPTQQPLRMDDGNWIMAGLNVGKGNPAAVAISNGDDFSRWDLIRIPAPKGIKMWGESTVMVTGKRVINIARYGAEARALVAVSLDYGRTWTTSVPSNLPMVTSKPYAGVLSTGQHYLICTTTADSGSRRSPLTIAVTRPGETVFSKVHVIRHAVFPEGPGESHKNAALAYPYAIEHDGHLFVGYSNNGGNVGRIGKGRELWNNNSAELAVVPIKNLRIE